MQFKQIDSKMKEIYFEAKLVQESEKVIESRYNFWNSMNIVAMNNMTIQRMKMA